MYKRLLKKFNFFNFLDHYPEFRLGSLLVALLCTFLIVIATFTQFKLYVLIIPVECFLHPINYFADIRTTSDFTMPYYYIPQIPAILFAGALLGPNIGLMSVIIYIIAGLAGIPVFASGGGINYYTQLGFGYILGYSIGTFLTGKILSGPLNILKTLRATFVGVLSIHFIGIIYLSALMIIQHNSIFALIGWIWTLSGMQIGYDLLISFIAIGIAPFIRGIFWIAMD